MDDPAGNGTGRRVILFAAAASFLLFPFMGSAVNIVLPSIGRELSLDAITLGWITNAFLLSLATFLIPLGRIADIYGRTRVFTGGIAILTLASLLCGLATSGIMLISFRVLQGIGAAMITSAGVALLASLFPVVERGRVMGVVSAVICTGLSLGPILGGILTQNLGWRSIFFLAVPLGLAVFGIVLWKAKREWKGAKEKRFDLAGSIMYGLAIAALLYGLSALTGMLGVLLVVGGVVGLLTFARWEMRIRSPILDVNLFRNSRVFTFSTLAMLLGFSSMMAINFLISLHLQYVKGLSPEGAGLILVAMPAAVAIVSPLAGRLSDRIEPRIVASLGKVLTTIGLIMFVFLTETTSLQSVIGNLILVGFGLALFDAPNVNAAMSSAPRTAYGVASATVATMREIGSVLGMAVAMLMFALYIGGAEITPEHHLLFQDSMKMTFIILAILSFGGIFVSLARGKVR
jgi:EmrB/QacA subfamily drug resistance transporter